MSERQFFGDEAKRSVKGAISRVEAQTSAELVVAVRKRSGSYGVLAYHFGVGLGLSVMLILVFLPSVYDVGAIALDGLLGFALGSALAANFDTLLRALARQSTRIANVEQAARAAFFELGISRTSGRNGVLVYVSLFERRPVVLTDVAIDEGRLGDAWQGASRDLEQAVKHRDLKAFLRALESLGPILGRVFPRSENDVNELPDEVQ